jgi:O-antigen ligase
MVLDLIISIGAALVLAISANQFSFEVAPKAYLSPVDPLVWLVFFLWLIQRLRKRDLFRVVRLPICAVLFLAVCALSCLRATNRLTAFKDLFQFGEYFVAAFLVFSTVQASNSRRRLLAIVFSAVTAIIVTVAAVQYAQAGTEDFAVRGLFGNSHVLGGFLALALPVAFAVALYPGNWWWRVSAVLTVVAGAMVTLSGAAFLAVSTGCLLLAARRGRTALLATAVGITLLCAAILPRMPRANADAHYQSMACFTDDGEPVDRYPEWQAAAIMVLENPWLGVGIGNYQDNIGMYYGMLPSPNEATEPDTQNLYLVLAASAGIGAAIAFASLLVSAIVAGWQTAVRTADPLVSALASGAAAGLVGFAIAAFWSPLLVRGIGIPLAYVLATAFARETPADHDPPAAV